MRAHEESNILKIIVHLYEKQTEDFILIKIEFDSQRITLGNQHSLPFFVYQEQHSRRDVI